MQLIFDQNLSPRLVEMLTDLDPNSIHVQEIGLDRSPDSTLRTFAKNHQYVIVTKDADFHEHRILSGEPPNVIWIRRGNCSTEQVAVLLRQYREMIERLSETQVGFIVIR